MEQVRQESGQELLDGRKIIPREDDCTQEAQHAQVLQLLWVDEEAAPESEEALREYDRQRYVAPAIVRAVEQKRSPSRTILPRTQMVTASNVNLREEVSKAAPEALCQHPAEHPLCTPSTAAAGGSSLRPGNYGVTPNKCAGSVHECSLECPEG
jgi:hypothetical protein